MAACTNLAVLVVAVCGTFAACANTSFASASPVSVCSSHTCAPQEDHSLLQVGKRQAASKESAASSSELALASNALEAPAPVPLEKPFYLHIPKCGSSFATILAHHVCGSAIPAETSVLEPDGFFQAYGAQCPKSKFGRFESGHSPLLDGTPLNTVATMLRDPRGRAMSGYEDGLHNCWWMKERASCMHVPQEPCHGDVLLNSRWVRDPSVIDPLEYARCLENCTVNLLTGKLCDAEGEVDVEAAVRKVGKLGFVGLTEEWNMSICLFHAKFGGPILRSLMRNLRPGVAQTDGSDDERLEELTSKAEDRLKSWPATGEMRVYDAAVDRFWQEIEHYRISRETCQSQIDAATSMNS